MKVTAAAVDEFAGANTWKRRSERVAALCDADETNLHIAEQTDDASFTGTWKVITVPREQSWV